MGLMDLDVGDFVNKGSQILDGWQTLAAGRGRHTLKMGQVNAGDVVLYKESLRKAFKVLGKVEHTCRYRCKAGETITAVVAYDNWDDDTGGDPECVGGGVGQSSVAIKVTSAFQRGFDHTFTVYGKKK